MVSNGERKSAPAPGFEHCLTLQVAALADELQALADRMEADWTDHGSVPRDNVRQLRALREAAEQLLGADIGRRG